MRRADSLAAHAPKKDYPDRRRHLQRRAGVQPENSPGALCNLSCRAGIQAREIATQKRESRRQAGLPAAGRGEPDAVPVGLRACSPTAILPLPGRACNRAHGVLEKQRANIRAVHGYVKQGARPRRCRREKPGRAVRGRVTITEGKRAGSPFRKSLKMLNFQGAGAGRQTIRAKRTDNRAANMARANSSAFKWQTCPRTLGCFYASWGLAPEPDNPDAADPIYLALFRRYYDETMQRLERERQQRDG